MFQVRKMNWLIVITLVVAKLVLALDIKELNNPILPVHIGQSHVIDSRHTFLYHINLTYPENSLSLIKESLLQLENILNNLETAISFARINILHSSIIEPSYIESMIEKLKQIYGNTQIPKFKHLLNYYSLFSTQIIIQNKIVLFKIHTPLIKSQYKLFHLFPIPISNYTIIPEQPYMLLNTETFWTISEICPEIENWYFCLKSKLQRHQPCLAELIKTGKNSCPQTKIYYSETTATQIHSNSVLVVPARKTNIKTSCDTEGIYEATKPCLISLGTCKIFIDEEVFQSEQTTHEEFVFQLPPIETNQPEVNSEQETLHLKKVSLKEINQIKTLSKLIKTNELRRNPPDYSWINIPLIIIIITILAATIYLYFKLHPHHRCQHPIIQEKDDTQKTEEPLFSALRREEL